MPSNTLKFLVISYTILVFILWITLGYAGLNGAIIPISSPLVILAFLIALSILLAGIWTWLGGVIYVFYDSRRRGMDQTLWVLLVIFVPYLIGFVIYFIMRKPYLRNCPGCGKMSPSASAHCPYCGMALKNRCASCQAVLEKEYQFCPACGAKLTA